MLQAVWWLATWPYQEWCEDRKQKINQIGIRKIANKSEMLPAIEMETVEKCGNN